MGFDSADELDVRGRPPSADNDAIRSLVKRLSRHHSSGGEVIERAAIMAAGPDSVAILQWIEAHNGQPETVVPTSTRGGLHGGRLGGGQSSAPATPQRYVLPPGALS